MALLEEVCHWGFEVSNARAGPMALFLLVDPEAELSGTLKHHACQHATMLPIMTMD